MLPLGAWRWVALAIVALWLSVDRVRCRSPGITLRGSSLQLGRRRESRRRRRSPTSPNCSNRTTGSRDPQHARHRHIRRRARGGLLFARGVRRPSLAATSWATRLLDYLVLPRACRICSPASAFLWIFLLCRGVKELKNSMPEHLDRVHGRLARVRHAPDSKRVWPQVPIPELEEADAASAARVARRVST